MKLCKNLEVASEKIGRLNIYVDPRLELLAAMQVNANYPYLTPYSFNYIDRMKDYFSRYKTHKAIDVFERLFKKGFAYDAPPQLMLKLTKELELKNDIKDYNRPLITDEDHLEFVNVLKDYYETTNFERFYNENLDLYKKIVYDVASQVKEFDLVNKLEEFFGYSQNSYHIILSPVSINGGYGINDVDDCYAVCGAQEVDNSHPLFNTKVSFQGHTCDYIFTMLLWHEFIHSFVNPLTKKYIDEINKYNHLFKPLAEKLSQQGYGSWESFVNEQIIEAIVSIIVSMNISEKDAEINLLVNKEYKGFVYIDFLYEKIHQYVNNRDRYPTFKDFYPELIQMFKQI